MTSAFIAACVRSIAPCSALNCSISRLRTGLASSTIVNRAPTSPAEIIARLHRSRCGQIQSMSLSLQMTFGELGRSRTMTGVANQIDPNRNRRSLSSTFVGFAPFHLAPIPFASARFAEGNAPR